MIRNPTGTASRHGVTLIEMVIVVAIVGLIVALIFPATAAGLQSIRLASAADSTAAFLNAAMNRSQRRQDVIQVVVEPKENVMHLYSTEPGYQRILTLPDGIHIAGDEPWEFALYPGGTIPAISVTLTNSRGGQRIIRIDPTTGTPVILRGAS